MSVIGYDRDHDYRYARIIRDFERRRMWLQGHKKPHPNEGSTVSWGVWGAPCRSEALRRVRIFGTTKTWHVAGIGNLKFAELLALRTKYGRFLAARLAAGNTSDIQTYACRPIRGTTNTYSYHSWPRAIDIRPTENRMRDDGVLVCEYTKFGLVDGVNFVNAFLAAGFDWGATWDDTDGQPVDERCRLVRRDLLNVGKKVRDGRVDAMHFELDDDRDVQCEDYWIERVRHYRTRHPLYIRRVLQAAEVKTARDLVVKWYRGEA